MIWQIDRQTGQVEVVLNERDLDKVAIAVAELDFDILILFVIGFVQARIDYAIVSFSFCPFWSCNHMPRSTN